MTPTIDNRKAALVAILSSSLLMAFVGSSLTVALPTLGREFAMNAVFLGWIPTLFFLTTAMLLVPAGRVADIYGRKKIFAWGMGMYTLSSLLNAFAVAPEMVVLGQIGQGMGNALASATGVAILTSLFPVGERGKVLGLNVTAIYLGLSLGPCIGGFLIHYLGWRSIFLINGPLGLLIIAFTLWQLKGEWAESKGERFDFIGSGIYSLMLASLTCGLSLLPQMAGAWLILVGLLGLFAFVEWELHVQSPIFDMRLFQHNSVFALSNLAALIHYSATFAVTFLLSLYLQYTKELTPQNAGLILVSQPIMMALVSPFAGRLSDKIEPRVVASIGIACTTAGLFLLSFLQATTPLVWIVFNLILMGLGFALFSSPNINAIMSSVDKRSYGVAAATLSTMRVTGQVFSMGVVMLLFALYIGKIKITPQSYPLFLTTMQLAFRILAVFCLVGTFASLARGRVRD
jgi:EmrB/QacA subfamily drug resistance transporter